MINKKSQAMVTYKDINKRISKKPSDYDKS